MKTRARIVMLLLLALQLLIFYGINQVMYFDDSLYQTANSDEYYELRIEEGKQGRQSEMVFYEDQKSIAKRLITADRHSKFTDFWYTKNLLSIVVQNGEMTESYYLDFENPEVNLTETAFLALLKDDIKKDEERIEETKKIDTQMGYSLDHDMVEVTYNYGETWKKTPIYSSYMVFAGTSQLRLGDQSIHLTPEFSYMYEVDSKGWLNYFTSDDEGETWNQVQTSISAWSAKYFQNGLINGNPYIIMLDSTIGILTYYRSEDNGTYFQQKFLSIAKTNVAPAYSAILDDNTIFLSFQDERSIYRSTNEGTTFDKIDIQDSEDIRTFSAPEDTGTGLEMIGYAADASGGEFLFQSSDHGITWARVR